MCSLTTSVECSRLILHFNCSDHLLLELWYQGASFHPEVIAVKLAKICSVLRWLVPDKVNQVELANMSPRAVANAMVLHLSSILPGLRANQCHELSKPLQSDTVSKMFQAKAECLEEICATLARFTAQTSLRIKVRPSVRPFASGNVPLLFRTSICETFLKALENTLFAGADRSSRNRSFRQRRKPPRFSTRLRQDLYQCCSF